MTDTSAMENHPASIKTEMRFHPFSRRWFGLWLIAAVLLFLLQTVPYFSYRWVTDESWYAAPGFSLVHGEGLRNVSSGPNDLEAHLDVRPPGTALMIASSFRLFGEGEDSARLPSLLAGIGILLLSYSLAEVELGQIGGMVALFVLATDNLLILAARTARPEALTLCFALAALKLVQIYGRKRNAWLLPSAGLLTGMSAMFHVTMLGYLLSMVILIFTMETGRGWKRFFSLLLYSCGFVAGMLPFVVWVLHEPLGTAAVRFVYFNRATGTPLLTKFALETHRYVDLLGMHVLHGGLSWVPVRLPIVLVILGCLAVVAVRSRRLFILQLALLIPTMLWLVYTVNKSSRYLTLISPLLAFVIASAAALVWKERKLRQLIGVATILVVCMQFAGNLVLLRSYRHANYKEVGRELDSLIPPHASTYGTITFWLALRNHPYITYERTPPLIAAESYGTQYFITGDRMMTTGDQYDSFYTDLNHDLEKLKQRSVLVGEVTSDYYGRLHVYRITH